MNINACPSCGITEPPVGQTFCGACERDIQEHFMSGGDGGLAETPNSRPDGYPTDWDVRRRRVYARDGYRCNNCGASDTQVHAHHIVPLSKGGSNDLTNLTTLCTPCHTLIHPHMQEPVYAADWMRPGAVPLAKTGFSAFAENAGIFIGGAIGLIVIGGALGLTCRALGWESDPCASAPADVAGDCREYRDGDPRYDFEAPNTNIYDDPYYVPPSERY